MRVVANELQVPIGCLPMSTVSHEARSHAADFCHSKVKVTDMFYSIDAPGDKDRDVGTEILDHVLAQPTTVIVTKSRPRPSEPIDRKFPNIDADFESPEHLVDAVSRAFGSSVERIILDIGADVNDDLETIYWPHTLQTKKARKGAE